MKILNLTLQYGVTDSTPDAFAGFGYIQAFVFGKIKKGWFYTQLALHYGELYENELLKGRAYFAYSATLMNFVKSPDESLGFLHKAYHIGVSSGDFINAGNVTINIIQNEYFIGKNLSDTQEQSLQFLHFSQKIKYDDMVLYHTIIQHHIYKLQGIPENNWDSSVERETTNFNGRLEKTKYILLINVKHLLEGIHNYLTDNFTAAIEHFNYVQKNLFALQGTLFEYEYHFYSALLTDSLHSKKEIATSVYGKKIKKSLQIYKKVTLTKTSSLLPRKLILESLSNKYKGQSDTSKLNLQEALQTAEYLQQLQVIAIAKKLLSNSNQNVSGEADAFITWGFRNSQQRKEQIISVTNKEQPVNSLEGRLDLGSVMKASIAISGEVVVENLLTKLIHILIENSGATNGLLLTPKKGIWQIEAIGSNDEADYPKELIHQPANKVIPDSILHYVIRTSDTFISENLSAMSGNQNNADSHQNFKSVLCMPIIHKGSMSVIIFLYNNITANIFSKDRIEFLKMLSGQVAVSLDNAYLYENLENKVIERTEEVVQQAKIIEKEQQKSEALLKNILPESVAEELKLKGYATPTSFKEVTVMFTDFVDFTQRSEKLSAEELVAEIDFYYTAFDEIVEKHGLEKIKTIGDSYMCAGGIPIPNEDHAVQVVRAALDILSFTEKNKHKKGSIETFSIRIGIHTGPVIAGIVGKNKFAYDIWGDTVNTASRMESSGTPGKINISGPTFEKINDIFDCIYRGKIQAKHKDVVDMYYVVPSDNLNMENSNKTYDNVKDHILARIKNGFSPDMLYHGVHHIIDVESSAIDIANQEGIAEKDILLIKTAALLHDIGFIDSYKDHEEKSCDYARSILPEYGYSEADIEVITGMIMATKIPQKPKNILEEVLADADLDYLGRHDYDEIAETLYIEMKKFGLLENEAQWLDIQINFLRNHEYHTNWSKANRTETKKKVLKRLEARQIKAQD